MNVKIADFAPPDSEAGVGLVLQDEAGRYLFFLAGTRHRCPPGELFYAGIGGHREPGESWLACARREAREEVGAEIEILSASTTWFVPQRRSIRQIDVIDRPRPFAFYEMIHPPNTPRAGQLYRIVIYKARLRSRPKNLPPDEIRGVIALTAAQVARGAERKPTLAEVLAEGAWLVAGGEAVDAQTRLYPLGTARALSHLLPRIETYS
ncbi:MAG: NUDIX hydrolase [Chloroflexi bacterium]|nr:NUDIX hydrolase [Chloroflexota bacterium]